MRHQPADHTLNLCNLSVSALSGEQEYTWHADVLPHVHNISISRWWKNLQFFNLFFFYIFANWCVIVSLHLNCSSLVGSVTFIAHTLSYDGKTHQSVTLLLSLTIFFLHPVDSPLYTYRVVPVLYLLPRRWFSPGRPRTSHPVRRCLPGLCRSVHPKLLEPCRSQSRRWRRSAAWSDHRPSSPRSSCSDQSLPPRGWTRRLIEKN